MEQKLIVKPTDYVVGENGNLEYSYDYKKQYEDAEKLNQLSKEALLDECKKRSQEAIEFPVPSKISRLRLAEDLAMAKGYVGGLKSKAHTGDENQREF